MPRTLQRLSVVVQTILSLIECPVCLDTITPPAMQCQNGHLLCVDCRIRAEKCPVCRDRYFPRPALIAEQIHSAITSAFNLCRNEDKVRQKVFARHNRQRQMVKTTLLQTQQQKYQQLHKSFRANPLTKDEETNATTIDTKISDSVIAINRKCNRTGKDKFLSVCSSNIRSRTSCNKLFTRLLNSKAYSMENLTNVQSSPGNGITNTNFNTCQTTIKSAISQFEFFDMQQQQQQQQHYNSHKPLTGTRTLFKDFKTGQQQDEQQHQQISSSVTHTNQFYDATINVARNQHHLSTNECKPYYLYSSEGDLNLNTHLCCRQILNNKMKYFSLSSDKDYAKSKKNITCILESSITYLNDKNKVSNSPVIVCEASNVTNPRHTVYR